MRSKEQDVKIAKFLVEEGFDLEQISNILNHEQDAFFQVKNGKLLRDGEAIVESPIKFAELYGGLKEVLTRQKRWVRQTKGLGHCEITELTEDESRNIRLFYPRKLVKMERNGAVFKMEFFGPPGLKAV